MKEFFHRNTDALVALGIFCLAFFWKLPYLGIRDLSLDEPFTLYHSQKSVLEIIKLSGNREPNPPLFMILVHYWSLLVGYSEENLRILPLLFNSLTASVLYLIGKKFFSLWAGLLSTGLFLFSNYYFFYASELRPYGLFSLATAGALYYFLKAEKSLSTRGLLGLLCCNVVLIYNHYFGWFVIGVEGLCALFYVSNRPLFKRYIGVLLLTFLSFIPMISVVIDQFAHSSQKTWVDPPKADEFRIQLHALVNSGMVYRLLEHLIPIGLILALMLKKLSQTPKRYLVVLVWWLVPFSLMFYLSDHVPMFIDRYLLYCSIGLFIFIGAFIERFAHFWWLQLALSGLLVIYMAGRFNSGEYYIQREIASAVEEVKSVHTDSSVVIIHPEWAKLNFAYHYDLEMFKNDQGLKEELHQSRIFPVWNAEQAIHVADSIGAKEIVFFTNGGVTDPEVKRFLMSLSENGVRVSTKNFPDNLTVSKYKN